MPVQRLRIRLLLPVHGGILFPPLPGRQAVALLEGLGEVELVGVAAPAGDEVGFFLAVFHLSNRCAVNVLPVQTYYTILWLLTAIKVTI